MPRVKLNKPDTSFSRKIKARMKYLEISPEQIAKAQGFSVSTHHKRMREPDTITRGEYRVYVRLLHISDEDILQDLKGERR